MMLEAFVLVLGCVSLALGGMAGSLFWHVSLERDRRAELDGLRQECAHLREHLHQAREAAFWRPREAPAPVLVPRPGARAVTRPKTIRETLRGNSIPTTRELIDDDDDEPTYRTDGWSSLWR